jgi:hypothetical protein
MTNNKQQTAVEWIAIALYENGFLTGNVDEIQELLEQAKEMEKAQSQHWFKFGMLLVEGHLWKPMDKFEQYYNENHEQNN